MRIITKSFFFALILGVVWIAPVSLTRAEIPGESGTEPVTEAAIEINLKNGTPEEAQAKKQIRRLLTKYGLDDWIFTREILIDATELPHSHPVLTLNTSDLNRDDWQLSDFLHEQAHWFIVTRDSAEEAAIEELRRMYPNPPPHREIGTRSEESTYLHLIVNWQELDGLAEFLGEERGRELLAKKDHYEWVYERILQETDRIGAVLARHGLVLTPERGLIVQPDEQ
ncbi:hypothetical protein [Wenzhouxiangella sp. EGI_FJ10305]|uniref:hypothetical protein n=1 Tax=Wenzhouxiangella sp. EGI_FJ10305 TaxID=3243768 RepID=UPI0035DA2E71